MAEVRKGKTENPTKPRTRSVASAAAAPATVRNRSKAGNHAPLAERSKSDLEVKRLLLETQDQLSLIHGVLEELCERQEAMAAWQLEFSKRLVSLQEAQWRSLEDIAGVDMGRPVEKAFGFQTNELDNDSDADHLDEANKMLDEVNQQAMPKKIERMRKRRDPLRPKTETSVAAEDEMLPEEHRRQESTLDSVFVLPPKVDVH